MFIGTILVALSLCGTLWTNHHFNQESIYPLFGYASQDTCYIQEVWPEGTDYYMDIMWEKHFVDGDNIVVIECVQYDGLFPQQGGSGKITHRYKIQECRRHK